MLHDEIYFEITLEGEKEQITRFASYALSGVLDDFFEISDEYLVYDDYYENAGENDVVTLIFTNDEYGIETDSFDPEEFLDVFCKGAQKLYVSGCIYDIDDEEYRFVSHEGDSSFTNVKNITKFNDELDEEAEREEREADDDYNT